MCDQTTNIKISDNKSTPLFSIIIPIYNTAQYLTECIESVIKQSFLNIEIILINDGSTDNSLSICNNYSLDNRVIIIDKENEGLSEARNTGIKVSNGEYIIFLDSDDKFASLNVLSELSNFINESNPNIIYCTSVMRFYNKENPKLDYISYQENFFTPCKLFNFTKKNNLIFAAWLFIIKKSLIIDNSLFFMKNLLHEDMEWIPRVLLADNNNIIYIFNLPFYLYRYNPDSITSHFNQKRFDSICQIISSLIKQIHNSKDKAFLISWFNMNLNNLILSISPESKNINKLFNSNIHTIKKIIIKNFFYLTLKNKIFYLIFLLNPKAFYKFKR